MSDPVKRRYRSPRRDAAAANTRTAIREAATSLFLEQGFAVTTMREVAARAGIGERTVYDAFASKTVLFHHVVDVAIVGDELEVAVADRPEFQAALADRDPERAVALFADYAAAILERAGPLIMVAVESAGAEPAMRRYSDQGAAATRANTKAFVTSLAARGVLAGDLDELSAVVYVLASPHVHQLLRKHSGWSPQQYRRWLRTTLARQLL